MFLQFANAITDFYIQVEAYNIISFTLEKIGIVTKVSLEPMSQEMQVFIYNRVNYEF